jgi:hypothetical protein
MNDNLGGPSNLLDTTDCLEAVGLFKGWKNILFIVIMLCLLLLQASFWFVHTGLIKIADKSGATMPRIVLAPAPDVNDPAGAHVAGPNEPNQPADANAGTRMETPEDTKATPDTPRRRGFLPFQITFEQVSWLLRFVNALLVLAAVLYCLTLLFSLKVSLIGRLGGINHVSRAFFLSLMMLVLLLPWQIVFGPAVPGALYMPSELARACAAKPGGIFEQVLLYLRFTAYWLLIVLLLILTQLRSTRWTRAILRRLEVI